VYCIRWQNRVISVRLATLAYKENDMKTILGKLAVSFGALGLALLLVPNSLAQCGGISQPQAPRNHNGSHTGQPHLIQAGYVTVSDAQDTDPIVGFWHVHFISEGSKGIPDGTEIDAGYSQWHSDGTEIMNSGGRSPVTGDFCLGVWKNTNGKYKLNHFAAAWDGTGSNLIGPANIKENLALDPSGDSFSGTFTITQYDENGNKLGHVQGNITGTRIDTNTKADSIF
jgi:hypothetical protein